MEHGFQACGSNSLRSIQESPQPKYIDVNFNHGNDFTPRHLDSDDDHDIPDTRIMMPPVEQSVEPMDGDEEAAAIKLSLRPTTDDTDAIMVPHTLQPVIVPRGRYYVSSGYTPFRPFEHDTLLHGDNSHTMVPYETSESIVPHKTEEIRPPKRHQIEYDQANAALEAPTTYEDAIESPEAESWKKAIADELKALKEKKTWKMQKKEDNQKVIGTKWVFTIKRNEHGEIQRYNARLVAFGYRQTYGVDYEETYSPVANMNSIRVFLSVCCQEGFLVHQYDVNTAFLNGHPEGEVFIYPQRGVEGKQNQICKLNRSLYGLKQSAATWLNTISEVFTYMGFSQCRSDSCIFIRQQGNSIIYITLYVDDMLVVATTTEEIEDMHTKLSNRFKMKDLVNARFVLGIEVSYKREARKLKINQESSIRRMVERFNQEKAKSITNPCLQGQFLLKMEQEDSRMKNRPFRSLVGSLLYISTGTRPDIAFSVCQLSRHLEKPSEEHWNAAICILRYLKTTASNGII
uniref:Putative polyprotein n=1 Tax=Albugo laibachii Nc14 TaxID=890382 RepID=F0X1E7_9STRA|nr:putative polyprotein [Albugo laibachii Nc14]|eukprot:CCA27625.1 putative polyprotein [Albugo laibachii Nc14]